MSYQMSYRNPTTEEIKENPEKALKIIEDIKQYIERLEEENEETVKQLNDSLGKNIDNQKEIDQRKEEIRKYEEEIDEKDKKIKELKTENRQLCDKNWGLNHEVCKLLKKNSEFSDKIQQQRKLNEDLKDLLDYISELHDEELKQKFYKYLENNNTILDGMLHALKKMIPPAANRNAEIVNNSLHQLQGISPPQSPQPVLITQLNDGTQPHIGKPLAHSTPQRFPFRNYSYPPPDPSFLDQLPAKDSGLGLENLVQEEEENWESFEDEEQQLETEMPMEIGEDGQSQEEMVPKEEMIENAGEQQDKVEVKDEFDGDETINVSIETLKVENEEDEQKKVEEEKEVVEKKDEKLEEGQSHGEQTEEEAQLSQQRFHQWLEISGFLLFIFFVAFILPTFLLNLLEYSGLYPAIPPEESVGQFEFALYFLLVFSILTAETN